MMIGEEEVEHPLKNDLILASLSSACSWKELNVVRQVCKDWHRASLPVWRAKAPTFILGTNNRFDSDDSACHSMRKFLEVVEVASDGGGGGGEEKLRAAGLCQYKHFEIRDFQTAGDWNLLKSFLGKLGPWITQLTLHNITFPNLEDFRELMTCRQTPSLQCLKLEFIHCEFEFPKEENSSFDLSSEVAVVSSSSSSEFQNWRRNCNINNVHSLDIEFWHEHETKLPVSWTELLQWYPNLQHLRLAEGDNGFWRQEGDKLVNAITKLRRANPNNLRLKSLDVVELQDFEDNSTLRPRPPTSWLQKLFTNDNNNNDFHFENLGLHITSDVMLTELHGVVLPGQANSLKRLSLRKNNISSSPQRNNNIQIPTILNCLQSITLFGGALPDLTFMKKCPNLQSITLKLGIMDQQFASQMIRDTTVEDMEEGFVLPSLRELCLDHGDEAGNWEGQDWRNLSVWIPYLRCLEVQKLSADNFRMVCRVWPLLETLKFHHGTDVDDDVITGIPGRGRRGSRQRHHQNRPYSNITDLQELRCLHLVFTATRVKLSDKSVLFGFLQLPNLTSLSFKAKSITRSTLDLLKKKIPDVDVKYNVLL